MEKKTDRKRKNGMIKELLKIFRRASISIVRCLTSMFWFNVSWLLMNSLILENNSVVIYPSLPLIPMYLNLILGIGTFMYYYKSTRWN